MSMPRRRYDTCTFSLLPIASAPLRSSVALLGCVLCVSLVGCLSQNPPATPRYFLPSSTPSTPLSRPESGAPTPVLTLDRVNAAPHLRENIVWRVSSVEIGLDDINRWGAHPRDLAELRLREALYESARFQEGRGGATLDLRLVAFEARLEHQDAHVAWIATLRHPHTTRASDARTDNSGRQRVETRRFESQSDVSLSGNSSPSRQEVAQLVLALGSALSDVAEQTADWATTTLNSR